MVKFSVQKFISELASFFAKDDLQGAGQCLLEWRKRAADAGNKNGELTVLNEMTGFYRQTKDEEAGMAAINGAIVLIRELGIEKSTSAATIFLNCATTMKSFGKAAEAMEFYNITLENYKLNLDENHPLVAL